MADHGLDERPPGLTDLEKSASFSAWHFAGDWRAHLPGAARAVAGGGFQGTDRSLRRLAPDIALYGNLGAAQLREYDTDDMRRAVDMIDADALIIHLNPLQEALQARGDTRWSAVEGHLATDPQQAALAEIFRDWGLPTATALREVRAALPALPLIGSGGIRHGLDAAKALGLRASLVGQASPIPPPNCPIRRSLLQCCVQSRGWPSSRQKPPQVESCCTPGVA